MKAQRRLGAMAALAAVVLASMVLTGCAGDSRPEGDPTIRGVLTELSAQQSDDVLGSIRVVWTEDSAVGAQADYDAAQLTITSDTTLARGASAQGSTEPMAFGDLRVGDIVDVWFTDGPVAESYPVQAGAAYVLVKGTYAGELPTPPGLALPAE